MPGLILSSEHDSNVDIVNNELPVSTIYGVGSVQDGQNVLANAKANWDGKSPLFVSLGVLAWNMTPTDVVNLTNTLGPEYQIVRADQYFSLVRQAYSLPPKP